VRSSYDLRASITLTIFLPFMLLNIFRLFQRRSSQRVKTIVDRQKEKCRSGEDDDLPNSEEESDSKLTHSEKYLVQKEKQLVAKSKIREKIQQDRALRAQRRLEAKP
jgi:hypothetical protein